MRKLIKVVGALIENKNKEILCALRSPKMSIPNTCEFPGGKVEENETLKEAIEREIKEELSCNVEFIDIFNDTTYEYENFTVNLITVKCKLIFGKPTANEHSKLIWLPRENLHSLIWAPADIATVDMLAKEEV